MWEPVFLRVACDTLGLRVVRAGSVSGEPPDIPAPGTICIDVDPFPVGGVVGAVVKARAEGQAFLPAPVHRNAIDVEVASALGDERQPLAIRRPTVEIARGVGSK